MTVPFVATAWIVTAADEVSTLFCQSLSVPFTRWVPTGKFTAAMALAAVIAAKAAASTTDVELFLFIICTPF